MVMLPFRIKFRVNIVSKRAAWSYFFLNRAYVHNFFKSGMLHISWTDQMSRKTRENPFICTQT